MMNVAIVGNSNCVFKDGFSSGIENYVKQCGGVVKNYSLGGSCSGFHIFSYHERYSDLISSDLVIIDSHVIDSFHMRRGVARADDLAILIDDMYALYSRLPAKVISIIFPIERHIGNYKSLPSYVAHVESAKKYGVDIVDLYSLFPDGTKDHSKFFMQPSHIRLELARNIGFTLAASLDGVVNGCGSSDVAVSPYEIVREDALGELDAVSVESSYISADCYRLDRCVSLSAFAGKSVVGVMHWNKTSASKLVVSTSGDDDVIWCRSQYAFFEVLYSPHKINDCTVVRPGGYGEGLTQKPAGKLREAEYGFPQLMGFLVRGCDTAPLPEVCANEDLSWLVGNVFG